MKRTKHNSGGAEKVSKSLARRRSAAAGEPTVDGQEPEILAAGDCVGKTRSEDARISCAMAACGSLVKTARENFADPMQQKLAVLGAVTSLAGVKSWTPAMVTRVERVMRLAVVLIALVACGRAATVVRETEVRAAGGGRATGKLTISATTPFRAASGVWVEAIAREVRVSNGAFSISLEPNIAQTSYTVVWELDGGQKRTEYWVVTGTGPLGVSDVVAARVAPGMTVLPPQVLARGLSDGTYCWAVAGGMVTGLVACAGAGTSLRWSTLTSGQWGGMTSSQWGALAQ